MMARRLLVGMGCALVLAATGALLCYLHAGENMWMAPVHLPFGIRMPVRLAPLLRLATDATGRRALDGVTWHTRIGTLHFRDRDQGLLIDCDHCRLRLARLAATPVQVPHLFLQLRRDANHVSGWLSASGPAAGPRATFDGVLADDALTLRWSLERAPLSDLLAALASVVPEARAAQVRGLVSVHGTLELPAARWSAVPSVEGLEVYGLGTERLRYGPFYHTCHDADGRPLVRLTGDGTPGWVARQRIGSALRHAILAAEDARFYRHPGYDMEELAPLMANANRPPRGASTITQQLAKNFFTGADASVARKLRELLYAVEMERTLGKQRILELYLNTADWGPCLCGIAAASHAYFARRPAQLTYVQAAWLAGALHNPHRAFRTEFVGRKVDQRRLAWVMARLHRPVRQQDRAALHFAPVPDARRGACRLSSTAPFAESSRWLGKIPRHGNGTSRLAGHRTSDRPEGGKQAAEH